MVIICPALRIPGCVQGSSELSYRQVAARDYRVPEGDRPSFRQKEFFDECIIVKSTFSLFPF
jgi:hypothetical protein